MTKPTAAELLERIENEPRWKGHDWLVLDVLACLLRHSIAQQLADETDSAAADKPSDGQGMR